MILEKIRSNKKLKWATTATLLWIVASVFIICFNRWEDYRLSDFDGLTDIILLVFFIPLGIACLVAAPIVMKSKAFNRTAIALTSLALVIATILVIEDAVKTYRAKRHPPMSLSEYLSKNGDSIESALNRIKERREVPSPNSQTRTPGQRETYAETINRILAEEEAMSTEKSSTSSH